MRRWLPWCICLVGLRGVAQLAIPGLLPDPDPDPGPVEDTIFVPAPENREGLFAGTNQVPDETAAPSESDGPDPKLLKMLGAVNPVMINRVQNELKPRTWELLEDGPSNVWVQINLRSGDTLSGTALNQPLLLQTRIGRMVVRLDQVRELVWDPDTGQHRIRLSGGDRVTGKVDTPFVDLRQPDGGKHRVPVPSWGGLSAEAAP